MDASMACRPPQRSQLSADRIQSDNKLSSSLWSTTHFLLQCRKPILGRSLKSQSRKPYASLFQRISNQPSYSCCFASPFQGSSLLRELPHQELILPGVTSYREAARWVCFGGGRRPRRPHIWKTKQRRGSFTRAEKFLEFIKPLSNVKEDVYAALDAFVAWDLDFPVIPIKKALCVLEMRHEWPRVIQVIKWMLGKGQGRSFATYFLLLKAFSEEGRVDEAREVWNTFFGRHLEHTPTKFFEQIMRLYQQYEMHNEIIDIFADMEELQVNLNGCLVGIVSETYEKLGMMEKAQKVQAKYALIKYHYRTINGRVVRRPADKPFPGTEVSRWVKSESGEEASIVINNEASGGLDNELEEYYRGLGNEGPDEPEAVEKFGHGSSIDTYLDGNSNEDWRSLDSHDSFEEAVWRGYESADQKPIDSGLVTLPLRQGVPVV